MSDKFSELSAQIEEKPTSPLNGFTEKFERFVSEGHHFYAVNRLISAITNDFDDAGFSTNGKFIPLDAAGYISIALVRYTSPTQHILWGDEDYLQLQLSNENCSIDEYELPKNFAESVFNPELKVEFLRSSESMKGKIFSKTPMSIIDLRSEFKYPIHFIRLTRQTDSNFEWAFHRLTFKAHSIITKRQNESNLLGIIDLLSQVGNDRSISLISSLKSNPFHFVRWRALQAIVRLCPSDALHHAEDFLDDVHPEIREAANITISAIQSRNAPHAIV